MIQKSTWTHCFSLSSHQIWGCWAKLLLSFCWVESGARTTEMPKHPNLPRKLMGTKERRTRPLLWSIRPLGAPEGPEARWAQLRLDRKLQQVVEGLSSPAIWGCTSSKTPEWRVTMGQQQGKMLFTPFPSCWTIFFRDLFIYCTWQLEQKFDNIAVVQQFFCFFLRVQTFLQILH